MSEHTPETDALCSDPSIERRDVPSRVWREMARMESERNKLRLQVMELVKALNELLYGTNCYLDTESRSVFHFTTEQLAQARAALAKAKP